MSFFLSLFASLVAIFILVPLSKVLGLLDYPDSRKTHEGAVPLVGGIAIFFATCLACLYMYPSDTFIQLYLLSAGLIVVLGAFDDRHELSVKFRLLMQILIACILIFGAENYIHQFQTMFGFPADIAEAGMFLTIFAVMGAINAFNFVDGIDGLAGLLALNAFVNLAILFFMGGEYFYWAFPVIVSAALIPYLLANLGMFGIQNKIFLGDSGSMFIGLTLIWLLTLGTQGEEASFRTVTALWAIALPLMDMAAIILRRSLKGGSPFEADRQHLHHLLLDRGFSSKATLGIIMLVSFVFSTVAILGELFQYPDYFLFYGFLLTFAVYFFVLKKLELSPEPN